MKYLFFCSLLIWGCHNVSNTQQTSVKNETDSSQVAKKIQEKILFDNDTIVVYGIDSVSFFEQRQKYNVRPDTIPYISDFAQAKEMLKGKVVFGNWNEEKRIIDSLLDGEMFALLRFENGKVFDPNAQNEIWYDVGFVKYFPTEHIVLFEGGHTSDFSVDLRDGLIDVTRVGNPDYIVYSPNKHYRLNGWFPGQECSEYFIQKQVNGKYMFYAGIPIHLTQAGFDLCMIEDIFWVSDSELYFRNKYWGTTEDERLGFFKLVIK